MEREKIVITGVGGFTPLGNSPEEFWSGLIAGKSGIGPMTLCDPSDYPCQIAGEVNKFDPGQYLHIKETKRMARFSQLAVSAAIQAIDMSELIVTPGESNRMGVILGNGNGGFPTTESGVRTMIEKGGMKVSPFFMPMILPNMAASNVSRILGIKGYNSTVVTACSASNQAMGEALEGIIIREGAVLASGCIISQSTKIVDRNSGQITYGEIPPFSVCVPGTLPDKNNPMSPSLNCIVIIKKVDKRVREKTSLNELLRD